MIGMTAVCVVLENIGYLYLEMVSMTSNDNNGKYASDHEDEFHWC